ncbi:NADH-quinone oxidoreductase subunit J [bacterium]|nr:NADH-quinone oxidoreductase subunit J [bacterium]
MSNELINAAGQNWVGANLAFWFITAVVVGSATMAAFARNIVQAAYALFFTLLGVAGYFALLGSSFLAITQVVIYVGGILVLLMFGVLLTNRPLQERTHGELGRYLIAAIAGAVLLGGVLVRVVFSTPWKMAPAPAVPVPETAAIGRMLVGNYLLPLELAGMLLLLCLLGAAYLVRRQER